MENKVVSCIFNVKYWLMLCLVFIFASCSKDDEPELLQVTPENAIIEKNGSTTITIKSNKLWRISTTQAWLTFSMKSGVGDKRVEVFAKESGTSERTAIVTVKGENNSRQIVVTAAAKTKYYIYGDIAHYPKQTPFQPGAWDAAAMRFSDTDGLHFPTIPDDVYFSLNTLILDVSNAKDCDLKVMNAWWSATYYDHMPLVSGLNRIQITEQMAKDCAKGNGGQGKDLDLMLYSGTCTINAVYYEE